MTGLTARAHTLGGGPTRSVAAAATAASRRAAAVAPHNEVQPSVRYSTAQTLTSRPRLRSRSRASDGTGTAASAARGPRPIPSTAATSNDGGAHMPNSDPEPAAGAGALNAGSASASASASASKTNATARSPPAQLARFRDLAPLVKRLVLRVHPDMIATQPTESIQTNEASLADFFKLFDALRVVCTAAEAAAGLNDATGSSPTGLKANEPAATEASAALRQTYNFAFFFKSPAHDGKVRRAAFDFKMPHLFEDRMRVLVERGMAAAAVAHWLELSRDTLVKLAAVVELPLHVVLSSDHASVIEQHRRTMAAREAAARAAAAGASSTGSIDSETTGKPAVAYRLDGAEAALRANLLRNSPLVQGKREPFPQYGLSSGSVFPESARIRRADRVLARPAMVGPQPGVTRANASAGFSKLRAAMVGHHDALHLYHDVWLALHIRLTNGPGLFADATTASLYIPHSFDTGQLIAFVNEKLPLLIQSVSRKATGSQHGTPAGHQLHGRHPMGGRHS